MYRERPSRFNRAVVWENVISTEAEGRVLPDGCMDIIWMDDSLIVAGPDTTAYVGSEPVVHATGIRFAPGDGPAVLGVPASALRNQRVPLADLWPPALVRRLTDRVATATDRQAALEDITIDRMQPTDPAILGIVSELSAGANVAVAAAAIDMGERRLHRRCLDAFGYGPKTLARILRLGRALDLARTGAPFATVAAQIGYSDQAHLSREVKALAGVPLTALISP